MPDVRLDFSRCRKVWVPETETWNPPPPYVEVGVRFICDRPYALLADDMGGMKTAQAIIAAQFLHDANIIDRVIVVAPASVRPKVWFDKDLGQLYEQAFDDKLNIVSEYHAKVKRWEHGPSDARPLKWIVTNFEYIRNEHNLVTLFQYCGPRTMLVLDESSAVKGYKSDQTDACMRLRWLTNKNNRPILGALRCGRILLMNGTPVAESPMDMFSQGNLLHPSILDCKYVTHFRARYMIQVPVLRTGGQALKDKWGRPVMTQKDGEEGWTNLDDMKRRFAPYVLRREAKELGIDFALPPVALEVPLTAKTWKAYKEMRDGMVAWLDSGVATARQAGVQMMRLAQITSGFVGGVEDDPTDDVPDVLFDGISEPVQGRAYSEWSGRTRVVEVGREKLDFALAWHAELLRRNPNVKLLTWCRFVPELKRYLAEVAKFGHPVGAACGEKALNGEASQKDEREMALRLLHPKTAPVGPATVGATQGTGAMGLNFTACRTVLDISYDFSPWKKKQGDARVNRPGQTGPVSFYYLIAVGPKGQKTVDHHIAMTRLGKAQINDFVTAGWATRLSAALLDE